MKVIINHVWINKTILHNKMYLMKLPQIWYTFKNHYMLHNICSEMDNPFNQQIIQAGWPLTSTSRQNK